MREPINQFEKITDLKDMLKNQEKNLEIDQHTYTKQMLKENFV